MNVPASHAAKMQDVTIIMVAFLAPVIVDMIKMTKTYVKVRI